MHEFLVNSQDDEIAKKYGLRSGVGIAAPQLNISKRMLAVHLPDDGEGKSYELMLINLNCQLQCSRSVSADWRRLLKCR